MDKYVGIGALYGHIPPLFAPLFEGCEYPWQVLPRIRDFLTSLLASPPKDFREIKAGVLVGEGVRIAPTATIEPPGILLAGCEVRPGAFLRGSVLAGEGCVIGNSSELKNCVLMNGVAVPHYNYVGDSVLGEGAHLGAGAITSNVKGDKSSVCIHVGPLTLETGMKKCGAFLGDGAEIGCGSVLNPGTVVGRGTQVYPLCAVRGYLPADSICKGAGLVVKKRRPGGSD